MELPGVPTTNEWLCPLCEVDQLSAAEDLYEDSELEDLHEFLFDDIMEDIDIETEVAIRFINFCRRDNCSKCF